MKVYANAFAAGRAAPGAVVAVGKFDGLHRGHAALLRLAARRAAALGALLLVATFDPSPEAFFDRDAHAPIQTRAQLLAGLESLGADAALFLPFTRRLVCQAPRAFARDVLGRALKAAEVCVGSDFCFGEDRAGRVPHLREFGREYGFAVRAAPLVRVGGRKVSSSEIRRLLAAGRRREAERLLGRALPS
ncbi:MAG: hypothetical protein KGM24_07320 [Elusimicrobia bacterium]|nr:hypothetical protein [Elusimicrobiota bacterium]